MIPIIVYNNPESIYGYFSIFIGPPNKPVKIINERKQLTSIWAYKALAQSVNMIVRLIRDQVDIHLTCISAADLDY